MKERDIKRMLYKICNQEFTEGTYIKNQGKVQISQEDRKFLKILEDGAKMKDGHYQSPLSFGEANLRHPNNRFQAEKRLSYLIKKLNKNKKFKKGYITFMQEIISKGCAMKSPKEQLAGQCWCLPYHGVYHSNKPGKIRVVLI